MRQKSGTNLLKRSANEVRRYRIYKKVIPICLACIAIVVGIAYAVSVMYTRFGSFTVAVDKYHSLQYGLALYENHNNPKHTASLNTRCSEVITNIDGTQLDQIDLGAIDGADNGQNYLCYTFYCENTGEEEISFDYSINIVNMTMGIEAAVRVRLITTYNGTEKKTVDYARMGYNPETGESKPEETPHETTPFWNRTVVMLENQKNFKPHDVNKYTVVIWLEGTDRDCIDDIIGGEFKIDMKFSVVSAGGVEVK